MHRKRRSKEANLIFGSRCKLLIDTSWDGNAACVCRTHKTHVSHYLIVSSFTVLVAIALIMFFPSFLSCYYFPNSCIDLEAVLIIRSFLVPLHLLPIRMRISALSRSVFHFCQSCSPVRLPFSRVCHETECEPKCVWPPLSIFFLLSLCVRVFLELLQAKNFAKNWHYSRTAVPS